MDHITEVYLGTLNPAAKEATRRRIHWLCGQAKGARILDVGCSQGITAVLLAREGYTALGMDLSDEAIQYANEFIRSESEETRGKLRFAAANFLDYDFAGQKYDTIIMAEIIEHLTNPTMLLDKAVSLLNPGGRVVITVPFGIMDHPDHKATYYLSGLLKVLPAALSVEKVEFMDEWIGLVCAAEPAAVMSDIPLSLLEDLEKSFYRRERRLTDKLDEYGKKIASLREAAKNSSVPAAPAGGADAHEVEALKASVDRLNRMLDVCHMQILVLQSENAIMSERLNRHKTAAETPDKRKPAVGPVGKIKYYLKTYGFWATVKAMLKKVLHR